MSGAGWSREVEEKDALKRRVRSVQGHLEGIERMVEVDVGCVDLLRQLQAVQGALRRLRLQLLHRHLRRCARSAPTEGHCVRWGTGGLLDVERLREDWRIDPGGSQEDEEARAAGSPLPD